MKIAGCKKGGLLMIMSSIFVKVIESISFGYIFDVSFFCRVGE